MTLFRSHHSRLGYGLFRSSSIIRNLQRCESGSPIGLVAGWGKFPVQVAQALVAGNHRVVCVAINDHASSDLESICDHVVWSGVGKLGRHIRYFQKCGVQNVTMAGKLFKSDLFFKGSIWLKHFPDLKALKTFGPHFFGRKRDTRDDKLLLAVTHAYQSAGIEVCPATDFATELLVDHGLLAGRAPAPRVQRDIELGWQVAKQMGGMDIGQSITIKDGTVIAVEAIEGTDACIERTGQLCQSGWTLVKVSKPNQDMRFDVPTIGPQTIQRVHAGGGKAIAIEADKTILVDRELTLQLAREAGISIVAVSDDSQCVHAPNVGNVASRAA